MGIKKIDFDAQTLAKICIAWFTIPLALVLWPFIEWQEDDRFIRTAVAWLFIPLAIGLWPILAVRAKKA